MLFFAAGNQSGVGEKKTPDDIRREAKHPQGEQIANLFYGFRIFLLSVQS